MVLVCNNQQAAIEILDNFNYEPNPTSQVRLIRMHGKNHITFKQLHEDKNWQKVATEISALEKSPELDLGDDLV